MVENLRFKYIKDIERFLKERRDKVKKKGIEARISISKGDFPDSRIGREEYDAFHIEWVFEKKYGEWCLVDKICALDLAEYEFLDEESYCLSTRCDDLIDKISYLNEKLDDLPEWSEFKMELLHTLIDSEKKGLERKLSEIKEKRSNDPEDAHGEADDALCDFLDDLGLGDLADLYDKIPKWYA